MSSKRIVTGAHYGLKDWLLQRMTAVVLVVYTIVLLACVLMTKELTYGVWATLFASTWMKVLTLLAGAAMLYHAWVGVRDIFMDYIKPTGLRLTLQSLTVVVLAGYAAWLAIILWRV
jgi:succinate dehydrogenase / fumarate reductase, membrane anchor subunit